MKNQTFLSIAAGAAATIAIAGPAAADDHKEKSDERAQWKAESPEVVESNDRGQATKVRIGDTVYEVCMTQEQDSCIQPRAAGLNWGNRPLMRWPGEPASSM